MVVVVVNMWIGIPYTMLTFSGVLLNIPSDLYESAQMDGAGPVRQFVSITLPYMVFITAPATITTFVTNINNFNVIYLLTAGGPFSLDRGPARLCAGLHHRHLHLHDRFLLLACRL